MNFLPNKNPSFQKGFYVMRLSGDHDADVRISVIRSVPIHVQTVRLEFTGQDEIAIRRARSLLFSFCFTEDLLFISISSVLFW